MMSLKLHFLHRCIKEVCISKDNDEKSVDEDEAKNMTIEEFEEMFVALNPLVTVLEHCIK